MDLNTFKKYCLSKKGATENFPFDEETLVFKVGTKMFGLTNINSSILSINLKCNPLMSLDLRHEHPAIKPGYHMNKTHWNTVIIDGSLSDEIIRFLIDISYDLVFSGLKKAEKALIRNI